MLDYDTAEMKSDNGGSLRYEVERTASLHAVRISKIISSANAYGELMERLPSKRVSLYFQFLVKSIILPHIRQACVIEWYLANGKNISEDDRKVSVPNRDIFVCLKESWSFSRAVLELSDNAESYKYLFVKYVKQIRNFLLEFMGPIGSRKSCCSIAAQKHLMIACHLGEGIDPLRRNDFNWFDSSGIDPSRILVYMDHSDNETGKPISKQFIEEIENKGFKWVSLKKGIVEGRYNDYWQPPKIPKSSLLTGEYKRCSLDRWIVENGNALIRDVFYWESFYDEFNIGIHYVPGEALIENIVHVIVFDIRKNRYGLLVGRQRSEMFWPNRYLIGFHPKHVFFVWNNRVKDYLIPNDNMIESIVVTGYTFMINRNKNNTSAVKTIRANGADFVIALFDNVHSKNSHSSTKKMEEFYRLFLNWLIEDDSLGIIVKSKKPLVLKNLPSVNALIEKACSTGRCIVLDRPYGRSASDASFSADIAVGTGISTAVIETAILGVRAVHYDMTTLKIHEFYKWGYERLIFDNIHRLLEVLKEYKYNPLSNDGLGNWEEYLDKLDSFHDNNGEIRMGAYMGHLYEAVSLGRGRYDAIDYANRLYAKKFGKNMIYDMRCEYAVS